MYQDPIAGRAAQLIAHSDCNGILSGNAADRSDVWEDAAESCVLARIDSLKILGGLPRHTPPLPRQDKLQRLETLLKFWASGCTCIVDEPLFADILNRRRPRPAAKG
ncbi:hypothetical protein [Roseibium sp. RKSG952]|uniref:hypothetical protein n=1 Tax=Roseibium sp. RKSG952 TaxID=2529384 RepID=UPI0012BD1441|nr:hypothetical protein [Roseibium sp. RKSG952]MTI00634.1 hypothetical protein [Roseibium sp. RKSG952]